MAELIHSSYYRPRIFPYNGDVADAEIDRVQSIDPTVSQNREKVEEVGNPTPVGYVKKIPSIAYRMTQLEYGSMEFWKKITNKSDTVKSITLADFKTPAFDICGYLTDDAGTFRATVQYPKLRTSGFSISIADPDANIERSFDFVGEKAIIWREGNKYFIYNRHLCGSGSDNEIDLSGKEPVEDPDNSGTYMIRVLRVRGSDTTELVDGTDYTYSSVTKVLTITSVQTDDVIKSYYTSATAPDTIFTANTSDPASILADSVDIYLYIPASGVPTASNKIHKIQSGTIDVSFDREDIKEVGSREVQKRGVTDSTVSVSLGRLLDNYTIEQVLRGVGSSYGKIDVEKFTDEATLIIKVYEDYTKTTFKYGFYATGLSSSELRGGAGINAYVNKENALEGEALTITEDETALPI